MSKSCVSEYVMGVDLATSGEKMADNLARGSVNIKILQTPLRLYSLSPHFLQVRLTLCFFNTMPIET